jgi:hypothetical protein
MSYNGYGIDTQGSYAMSDAEYLNNPAQGYGGLSPYEPRKATARQAVQSYGDYGGDPVLTTADRDTKKSKTKELQRLLIAKGYGSFLGEWQDDGDYYTSTKNAISAFQGASGLPVTGTATQATWDALRGAGAPGTAGGAPAKKTSWQEGLGTFASGLAQGVAGMLGGGTAAAATTAGGVPVTSMAAPKKSMMPWVIGGVSILAVGGIVYYMSTKKGTGNGAGNGKGKRKGRSK